jgi:HSP20 family protein
MEEIALEADRRKPRLFVMGDLEQLNIDIEKWRKAAGSRAWRPPTDVYETDRQVVVRVEVAGMREEDFNILLSGRRLTIQGVRSDVLERRAYHRMEINFGEFNCEVMLPCAVILEETQALYQDGFLRIILPKDLPRRVQVEE